MDKKNWEYYAIIKRMRIKDLGIRPETLQIIEGKVGPNLHLVGLGPDFLNRTPIAQES